MGSDHLPILLEITVGVKVLKVEKPSVLKGWNWSKADWPAFAVALDNDVPQMPSIVKESKYEDRCHRLVEGVAQLGAATLAAAGAHVGVVNRRASTKPWLTPEVKAAIKERNELRRQVATRRQEWVDKCAEVRTMISEAKDSAWREFLEDSAINEDAGKAWKLIKSLNDNPTAGPRNEDIVVNGRTISGSSAKADKFTRHYTSVNQLDLSRDDKAEAQNIRRQLSAARAQPMGEECRLFRKEELVEAINQMKSTSAAGPDSVAPRFIQHYGPATIGYLLDCINESWELGFCPQEWRDAIIIPLLKRGKPAAKLESYRPVSLTSCLAKTMERMVHNRLYYLAESRAWICNEQAGFRKLRGCEDQTVRLSQSISDGFQKKPMERTVMANFDYSKAYDKVWKTKLIGELLNIGVPYRYVAWCNGFLRNRQASVRLNNCTSRSRRMRQGLPQGAVLSPLLFSLYVNRIKGALPRGVEFGSYADDMSVWASDKSKMTALNRVRAASKIIARVSKEMKLPLSEEKCEVSFFSTDPAEASWRPRVTINGKDMKFNPNPVVLGVTYDRQLTFGPHVDKLCDKMMSRNPILAIVGNSKWGWRKEDLRVAYTALCRSVLAHCAPAWQPWVCGSNLEKIDRCQNKALRLITGMLQTTPLETLRLEAGVPSYATVSKRLCAKGYEKSLRLPRNNPRRGIMEENIKHRTCRSSLRESGREAAEEVTKLAETSRQEVRLPIQPPWKPPRSWSCQTNLIDAINKQAPQEELRACALDTIHQRYPDHQFVIYTDGSATAGTEIGGGAAVLTVGDPERPQNLGTRRRKGRKTTSSFETELLAIRLATEAIQEMDNPGSTLICSDSMASLSALSSTTSRVTDVAVTMEHLDRASERCEIKLQWVPAHVNLPGNEAADEAAKAAARNDEAVDDTMSYAAALAVINKRIKEPPMTKPENVVIYRTV